MSCYVISAGGIKVIEVTMEIRVCKRESASSCRGPHPLFLPGQAARSRHSQQSPLLVCSLSLTHKLSSFTLRQSSMHSSGSLPYRTTPHPCLPRLSFPKRLQHSRHSSCPLHRWDTSKVPTLQLHTDL